MTKIKDYALHSIIWLRRFRHRRGWTVHSPFAYKFIHEVVFRNTHNPSYATLAQLRKARGIQTSSRCDRLFLRLAAFGCSKTAFVFGQNAEVVARYIQAGSPDVSFIYVGHDLEEALRALVKVTELDMIYINAPEVQKRLYEVVIGRVHATTIMVLRGIYDTPEQELLWREVEQDERVIASFDLYYLGILLFRKEMSKEAFKICF